MFFLCFCFDYVFLSILCSFRRHLMFSFVLLICKFFSYSVGLVALLFSLPMFTIQPGKFLFSSSTLTMFDKSKSPEGHQSKLFFEGSSLTILDCLLFRKSYLDILTLLQCSSFAYDSTAVNWGSIMNEIFKEHFYRNTKAKKMTGTVQFYESLYG